MKTIKLFSFFLFFCASFGVFAQATMPSISYIKVDQFGYTQNAEKVAVISDPQVGFNNALAFSPGLTYQLRNWSSNAVVYSGPISQWNAGAVHDQSGDAGWWFDFSSVTQAGDYYIYDPTNDVRSHRFTIDDEIYDRVLKSAVRAFYYNRCGIAKQAPFAETGFTDATSFTQDANARYVLAKGNATLEKDLSGGWYDAGDFNKYITFAENTMHDLMWAYLENPSIFTDNWNIPESENGIPDLIDEIKWELDWMMKMNNADGSTHIKIGSQDYDDNTSTPPSLNTDTRFYGPTCTSAEIVVAGVFAQAAKLFQQFPTLTIYAQELEDRAETTWAYVYPDVISNNLDSLCDLGEIISGDADMAPAAQIDGFLKAAIHLYDLTGKAVYKNYITNNILNTEQVVSAYWSIYKRALNDAMLLYTTLPGSTATEQTAIRNSFIGQMSTFDFGISDIDLYRSYMPNGQYHWGSNQNKGTYGVMSLLVNKYNFDTPNADLYRAKAEEHVHYFHGLNPLSYVYLTNMNHLGAENSVNQMYHQWFGDESNWDDARTSLYGPAPGYVPGGPNVFTSVPQSPPFGQPQQKSYLDFNTSSTASPSWEISEPAIYYQSSYIRLLAAFSTAPEDCPTAGISCDDGDPKTTNDIEDGFCSCWGECPAIGTTCDDGDPLTNNDQENGLCLCEGQLPLQTCELVANGSLDTESAPWFNWGSDLVYANGEVTIENITVGNPWDAAFAQGAVSYTQGSNYTLKFKAAATANRTISVKCSLGDAGSTSIHFEDINVTTTMTEYVITFSNALTSTANGTVEFFVGISGEEVSFDDISIQENGCSNCPNGELNLAVNGGFDMSINPWIFWNNTPQSIGGEAHLLDIMTGAAEYDAGFGQQGFTWENGETYVLRFDASAVNPRNIFVKMGLDDATFTSYSYEQISLGGSMQEYSFSFTMSDPTSTLGSIYIYVGNDSPDVYIDNLIVTNGECNPNAGCAPNLYLPNPIASGSFQAGSYITSDATVNSIDIVDFHAGDYVELLSNFEVEGGASFEAYIEGCN